MCLLRGRQLNTVSLFLPCPYPSASSYCSPTWGRLCLSASAVTFLFFSPVCVGRSLSAPLLLSSRLCRLSGTTCTSISKSACWHSFRPKKMFWTRVTTRCNPKLRLARAAYGAKAGSTAHNRNWSSSPNKQPTFYSRSSPRSLVSSAVS